MTRITRIPLPVRVVVVLMMALLLSLVLLRPSSHDGRANATTNPPISGKCTGARQGVITGDVTLKGREGTYAISSLRHSLATPYDPSSGLPTGQQQHAPLVFTTNVSQATPKLLTAQITNEDLTSCAFNFYRTNASGVEVNYFRINLTHARITNYRLEGAPGGHDEVTFSLAYQRIKWTYVNGDIEAVADAQPTAAG